jgi:hypothetical protein
MMASFWFASSPARCRTNVCVWLLNWSTHKKHRFTWWGLPNSASNVEGTPLRHRHRVVKGNAARFLRGKRQPPVDVVGYLQGKGEKVTTKRDSRSSTRVDVGRVPIERRRPCAARLRPPPPHTTGDTKHPVPPPLGYLVEPGGAQFWGGGTVAWSPCATCTSNRRSLPGANDHLRHPRPRTGIHHSVRRGGKVAYRLRARQLHATSAGGGGKGEGANHRLVGL